MVDKNLNGFGGPGLSRYLDTAYEEEGERVIEDAPLAVGAEVVESSGWKAKRPEIFVEVLRDGRRFSKVGS